MSCVIMLRLAVWSASLSSYCSKVPPRWMCVHAQHIHLCDSSNETQSTQIQELLIYNLKCFVLGKLDHTSDYLQPACSTVLVQ